MFFYVFEYIFVLKHENKLNNINHIHTNSKTQITNRKNCEIHIIILNKFKFFLSFLKPCTVQCASTRKNIVQFFRQDNFY